MKIYLAGPWACREQVKAVRDHIHAIAPEIKVISRWLDHVVTGEPNEQAIEGQNDLDDLDRCDALMVMNLQKSEGKAAETGYALKARLPIVVVGEKSHVFHHLPRVQMVANVDAAIVWLMRLHYTMDQRATAEAKVPFAKAPQFDHVSKG